MSSIPKEPYALFTGSVRDPLACKIASGVRTWRPDLSACHVVADEDKSPDLNLIKVTSVREAYALGARSLVLCTKYDPQDEDPLHWTSVVEAIEHGMDIVGVSFEPLPYQKIFDYVDLKVTRPTSFRLFDLRHRHYERVCATGAVRSGLRLLTIGCDGTVGKMFAALAIHRALGDAGVPTTFRPTGQTGMLIAGLDKLGAAIDGIVIDFVSGVVERLSPNNAPGHWDIIEGQGSLLSPAWGGTAHQLLMGAQPDALVYCFDANRKTQRATVVPVADPFDDCEIAVRIARRVNPLCKVAGFSLNTSNLSDEAIGAAIRLLHECWCKLVDLELAHSRFYVFDPVNLAYNAGLTELMRRLKEWSEFDVAMRGAVL